MLDEQRRRRSHPIGGDLSVEVEIQREQHCPIRAEVDTAVVVGDIAREDLVALPFDGRATEWTCGVDQLLDDGFRSFDVDHGVLMVLFS